MSCDRARGTFGGRGPWRPGRVERRGPQSSGIGIEPEDDLRGARGYQAGESVAEANGF